MISKEAWIGAYNKFKSEHGRTPRYREFLEFTGFSKQSLIRTFGERAYSKLQMECGDDANTWGKERTPLELVMRQYGDLILELGKLPPSAVWVQRDLRPSVSGLEQKPHNIKWGQFPERFAEWVSSTRTKGYDKALEIIDAATPKTKNAPNRSNDEFGRVVDAVRRWVPARRRNGEGEYKIELRKHLESLGFPMNEEVGDSKFDLLVDKQYAIELKKAPNLSTYDRMFGQLARHLQHQRHVVALVMDVPREDAFENFVVLVAKYLNRDGNAVEVIGK